MDFFDEPPDELHGVITTPGEKLWIVRHCSRCDKRLARKTARLIDGKLLCSACLFPRTIKGLPQ